MKDGGGLLAAVVFDHSGDEAVGSQAHVAACERRTASLGFVAGAGSSGSRRGQRR